MLAWVVVRLPPVQVTEAPGKMGPTGQVIPVEISESLICTGWVIDVLPVLRITNSYPITTPVALNFVGEPLARRLSMIIDGVCGKGTTVGSLSVAAMPLSSDVSVTAGPVGGVPLAVAWFATDPALISDCNKA